MCREVGSGVASLPDLLRRLVSTARTSRAVQGARGGVQQPLAGVRRWLAFGFCLSLLTAGLLLPVGWLIWNLAQTTPDWARLVTASRNSLLLGFAGALVTVALATMLALGTRRLPIAARIASLGYATPGAVMAIGLLAPAGLIWSPYAASAAWFTRSLTVAPIWTIWTGKSLGSCKRMPSNPLMKLPGKWGRRRPRFGIVSGACAKPGSSCGRPLFWMPRLWDLKRVSSCLSERASTKWTGNANSCKFCAADLR